MRRSRSGRAALAAGALVVSAATFLAATALQATPAAAAAPSARAAGAGGDFVARVKPEGKARVAAAVLDLKGGGRSPSVYGDNARYDTASIVKVDILATALLQAQDAGHGLGKKEREQAEVMIRRSDNDAANALWREIGQAPGLAAGNKRLGLNRTKGGDGATWGLTRTTAADQIRLLRDVFDTRKAARPGSTELNKSSRAYIRNLMGRIAADQSWGVSAASGKGYALKNGWLQRSANGLWDVNSIGRVTTGKGKGKHQYLVAVLSNGSASMKDGVALVERAAKVAVSAQRTGKPKE
ncbi:serine hydrolase [Streptomyces sp. NPDC086787]|uniref:serine hydrolase n=1 Tax=Streptomyces sp. NPDC086787 TaxID=3365759 RepID=UPI0037F7AF25